MKKHGLTSNPIFLIWNQIKERCYNPNNPNYKNYGGRGILMSEQWLNNPQSFVEWAQNNGWQKGLEIDRRDNNKGYSEDNCRIVTAKVNSNNRRSNINLTYNGKTQTIQEWAEETNVPYSRLYTRIKLGWGAEIALSEPRQSLYNRREAERAEKRRIKQEQKLMNAAN